MGMSGYSCLTWRRFRRDPTDALFADQSQSILDNLVAFWRRSRAWNCSAGNCGCTQRDQQAQFRRERCSLLSAPLLTEEGAAMSDAATKSIVTSFNDCIGRRDITGLSSLMTDDHVFID